MGGIDPPHKECLRGQVWPSIEVQSIFLKDNIYIDMQAGRNLEVLRKCANSTISVVRMAFYPLDCC